MRSNHCFLLLLSTCFACSGPIDAPLESEASVQQPLSIDEDEDGIPDFPLPIPIPPLFTPRDYSDELSEGLTPITSDGIDWKAPISVRVISIADRTCAPLTTSTVKKAIDYMNSAGGSGGLKYRFYRHDVYPLPRDKRKDSVKWEDLKPISLPMGISKAAGDAFAASMAAAFGSPSGQLMIWLAEYTRQLMPNQVVMWQGCGGGVGMYGGAFFSQRGNFVHELGHGFSLPHTFDLEPDCRQWEFVYAGRGRGKANQYFYTRQDCDAFAAANAGNFTFFRRDSRKAKDAPDEGFWRVFSNGVVTVQHPRCKGCGVGLSIDDTADNGVERYETGDVELAPYVRFTDGVPAANALSYCSSECASDSMSYFSATQVRQMKAWTADNLWVFKQGDPKPINPPNHSCGYIEAGEGLPRDTPFYSCDGRFQLYLQADGNLVLSQKNSSGNFSIVLWATRPLVAGTDTTDIRLIMREDGNLAVYDSHRKVLWHSETKGNPGLYLKIANDGDLQVRSGSQTFWRTNTGGR